MTEIGQRVTLAKGGEGGKGNAFFKTSTNQAPRKSQPGRSFRRKMGLVKVKAYCRHRFGWTTKCW